MTTIYVSGQMGIADGEIPELQVEVEAVAVIENQEPAPWEFAKAKIRYRRALG